VKCCRSVWSPPKPRHSGFPSLQTEESDSCACLGVGQRWSRSLGFLCIWLEMSLPKCRPRLPRLWVWPDSQPACRRRDWRSIPISADSILIPFCHAGHSHGFVHGLEVRHFKVWRDNDSLGNDFYSPSYWDRQRHLSNTRERMILIDENPRTTFGLGIRGSKCFVVDAESNGVWAIFVRRVDPPKAFRAA
jgi:hypothetical protein